MRYDEATAKLEDYVRRVGGEDASLPTEQDADARSAPDALDCERTPTHEWPKLREEAYQGIAGEFTRLAEPHSEGDPVAILAQFLVLVGSAMGRNAYFTAGADRHYTNEFLGVVGDTAKGRKGQSLGFARTPILLADEGFRERIQSGLSSGEGVIYAVRDAEEGETDKRLMLAEGEFASCLRVMSRDGNSLSGVLRNAWDRSDLQTLTKNSPVRATGAHVSIIGHTTSQELEQYLSRTDAANGFGNRMIWVLSRRSKFLPEGGRFFEVDLGPVIRQIRAALEKVRKGGRRELQRDREAREIWHAVYPDLSRGKPGLLGAMIARSEAHVMRLALIYAVLDAADEIRKEHLLAALALWEYSEASARYIFGDSLGDPDADRLLKGLKAAGPAGLTRLKISDEVFQRNRRSADISRVLNLLQSQGLAEVETDPSTGGRPAEIWRLRRG